jgi:hypothetical protein
MANLFSRTRLQRNLAEVLGDSEAIEGLLGDQTLPDALKSWLTRLMLLYGVPVHYLVPDEGMLPPESIRFFYLDMNWVDAMIDGAFSIGSNLTPASDSASRNVDRALKPGVRAKVNANGGAIRAKAFGQAAPAVSLQVISGFLLRSALVRGYPGIGVNAYPLGGTPKDPVIDLLTILRLEQLGPQSDTIICLIDGDAVQVDVHEPPEGLHYGIDFYEDQGGVRATKMIHTFTRSEQVPPPPPPLKRSVITMSEDAEPLKDFNTCFRTGSPRTLMMTRVAELLSEANKGQAIDSAAMGFEMNQGVGQVSFLRRS